MRSIPKETQPMLKQTSLIVAVVLFGAACGGVHDVGQDSHQQSGQTQDGGSTQVATDAGVPACTGHGDCPAGACVMGVCRVACGPNYPGVTCPEGQGCDEWICRPTCASPCASGTSCSADGFCKPDACGANTPCPANFACSQGTCIQVGHACNIQQPCASSSLDCVNERCVLPCGPNAPDNFCEMGAVCTASFYCGYQ
jgi:hypothetical protein